MKIRPSDPHAGGARPAKASPQEPGLLIVQVDGLGHAQLQEALDAGLMPNLKKRLEAGELEGGGYRSGLPSQTACAQAGLFYGAEMPANQWFDKSLGRIVNSMGTADTDQVEAELGKGRDGLLQGGTVYLSPFEGEADRSVITLGELARAKERGGTRAMLGTLARDFAHLGWSLAVHPLQAVRTGVDFAVFAVREAWRRRQNDIPRDGLKEKVVPPLWNAMNTVFFSDGAARGLTRRMAQADPVLYVDFPAFDEASHAYGPGKYAFESLKAVDRNLEVLLDAAEERKRPYHVVVLSDHGQVRGTHFHDLYGRTLTEHVQSLLPPGLPTPPDRPAVVSQDFGSGAHVYLNFSSASVERSELLRRAPGVLPGLRSHPGVACVVTREGAATVIEGKSGTVRVEGGRIRTIGTSPLAAFGDPAVLAREVHDAAHRQHAGDVIVFGERVDGTLVDFSTLPFRGLHGGMGEGQDQPFLLHSPGLPLDPSQIKDSAELFGLLEPHVPGR